LGVVLPVSFFERSGQAHYNSLAMIAETGEIVGVYRKSHIPDGPGYQEKYYFNPGDTGFRAFPTTVGTLGAAICWDQWYPETARAMVLQGAEVLLYPTAIGSEPEEAGAIDTSLLWRRAMIGHAVSNSCYLAAANRVGTERVDGHEQTYYGTSFIADYQGEVLAEADRITEAVVVATIDLHAARRFRAGMGFFRDRRPDLYTSLVTYDGRTRL
jgi:N-carbamoylputrescine amidase